MYNRYIPQSDGSYRKNAIQDHVPPKPAPKPDTGKPPPPPKPVPCNPPHRQEPVGDFLRQLLPKNFDTGDLFIVLLLLLMAGDSEEGRSNALLTLALYFIM